MAKNVLIFSDGTGQGSSMPAEELTNVCKLWNATKDAAPGRQVAFYDPGLGAKDASWWRWGHDLVSQATGLGISQNIKDTYDALIANYDPGDHVFLFGFSRGAYTVRSLGGVMTLCGIPTRDAAGRNPRTDQAARAALVEEAVSKVYKIYGDDAKKEQRRAAGAKYRDAYKCHTIDNSNPPFPYFIGVWDTVRALGVPGSSGLILWRHAFHDATLNPKVPFARHALSIDENREVFEPVLWEETEADKNGRIKQVWFAGVHSDVGGGYPESGLSDLALDWMVQEATSVPNPVIVDRAKLRLSGSHKAKQHNERTSWGHLWKEGTREKWAPDILKESEIGNRFKEANVPHMDGDRPYRPKSLSKHRTYLDFYKSG
jgi:uncharacterized protein (DUF2235 family)